MAASCLQSEFYDDYGLPWTITIYDKDASLITLAKAHTIKGSTVLTDEGDDADIFKRVIPKKLTWTIIMHSRDYTQLVKDAILNFYTGLTSSPEGRYYVELKQGTSVKFRGKLLIDVGDLVLTYHREITLQATDGLLQLEKVEYRPDGYDDSVPETLIEKQTFVQHFTECLKKNDVVDFFYNNPLFAGTTGPLFTTSANWTNSLLTAVGITGDIFYYVAKKNSYFEKNESKNYRKYDDIIKVLKDFITGFNGRIYFSNGAYHIEQLGYQDNLTLVRYAYGTNYNALASPGNKVTHDFTTNDDMYILTDPAIKYLPPIKAVRLKQNKKYDNVLGGINAFWHRTNADNRGPHNMGYTIGAGNQLLMDLRFDVVIDNPITMLNTRFIEFTFEVKLGNYYLKNSSTNPNYIIEDDGTPKILEWTTTPSTFVIQVNHITALFQPYFRDIPITFISDEIHEDGDFIIRLVSWRSLNSFLVETSETTKLIQFTLRKNSRVYVVTNGIGGLTEVPDNTVIYELGDVKNTIIIDAEMSYFDCDDVPVLNSLWFINKVGSSTFYYISASVNPWHDPDMYTDLPIQELMLKQMLGLRKKPNKIVKITTVRKDGIINNMDDRYAIGNDLYIPIKMVHNIDRGEYQMTLWSPLKDFSGANIIRFDDNEDDEQIAKNPVIEDIAASYQNISIKFYQKFTGVNDNYVTISEPLGFYFSSSLSPDIIDSRWTVIVNGIIQEYVDYTTFTFPLAGDELQIGQYTVNPDEDRFYFAYNENSTIILKYLKV